MNVPRCVNLKTLGELYIRGISPPGIGEGISGQLMKPMGFHDYNHLQKYSRAVLSDSGTISEESSIMNFPALNIRQAHERPEAMEEASVMMVGLSSDRILQGLNIILNQKRGIDRTVFKVADYSKPNVSEKVLRIIVSYTDYIKRKVWNE